MPRVVKSHKLGVFVTFVQPRLVIDCYQPINARAWDFLFTYIIIYVYVLRDAIQFILPVLS